MAVSFRLTLEQRGKSVDEKTGKTVTPGAMYVSRRRVKQYLHDRRYDRKVENKLAAKLEKELLKID